MKRCIECGALYLSSSTKCSACNYEPTYINGIQSYAPELAEQNSGFKSEYFIQLYEWERRSFWFRARNSLILWALRKYAPGFQSLLEVGCGTGFVLSQVSRAYPGTKLQGSELLIEGLKYSARRVPEAEFIQMDARNIPFNEEMDVIGAFDVLEHIKEDETVLEQIHVALKTNGCLMLTVPQHQFLWSSIDEYACHERRYSENELHSKIADAGFKILRSTSFVSLLLPLMYLSRRDNKSSEATSSPEDEFNIHPIVNSALSLVMRFEALIIKLGFSLPFGGSRLVVAKKIN